MKHQPTPQAIAEAIAAINPSELVADASIELELAGTAAYSVSVSVEPDPWTQLEDAGDIYGKLIWSSERQRPPECDGSAVIINRERGSRLWWLPYRERHVVYNDPPLERTVRRIAEDGFYMAILELKGPAQSLAGTHRVTLETVSVAGLEPDATVISDAIEELQQELAGTVERWSLYQPT